MSEQLSAWAGEFGAAYTDRNVIDWRKRLPAFQEMLAGLSLKSILEIGCNRGHNLVALSEFVDADCNLVGVEPNQHALEVAQASCRKASVVPGNAFQLAFPANQFDLVFTAGVLIHIAASELPKALDEIHRVSRRYILAVEYFAEQETPILYRGQTNLLWKRDFLALYQQRFPNLVLYRHGYWDVDRGFDRTHWWLLEKPFQTATS